MDCRRIDNLLETYNTYSKTHELEVRMCYKDHGISNVGPQLFESVLHDLQKYSVASVVHETVDIYDKGVRVVQSVDDPEAEKRIETKTRLMQYCNTESEIPYANLKWVLSSETPISWRDYSEKPIMSRHKTVYTFDIHDTWKLVFARVVTNTGRKSYEIEAECVTPTVTDADYRFITVYLERMFRSRCEPNIVRQVNSLLGKGHRFTPGLQWNMNKPINLKASHTHVTPATYRYFLKMDGIRYILFSFKNSVYIFNETSRIHVHDTVLPHGMILDAEHVIDASTSTFYIFDIMVYNWRDVRNMPFHRRHGIIKSLKLDPHMKALEASDDFDAARRHIETLLATSTSDGIVFVPLNEPYKNKVTYKYKLHHDLTIDFYTDNGRIFVIDARDMHVEFVDRITNEPIPTTEIPVFMDKRIVEFRYDTTEKIFEPIRIRGDKTRPNFISVAYDIWDDIQNPMDIVSFLKTI